MLKSMAKSPEVVIILPTRRKVLDTESIPGPQVGPLGLEHFPSSGREFGRINEGTGGVGWVNVRWLKVIRVKEDIIFRVPGIRNTSVQLAASLAKVNAIHCTLCVWMVGNVAKSSVLVVAEVPATTAFFGGSSR